MNANAALGNLRIEARLQNVSPIWKYGTYLELYRSRDGYFIVRCHVSDGVFYLGVSSETGEIRSISMPRAVNIGDLHAVTTAFGGAGFREMQEKARRWFDARR